MFWNAKNESVRVNGDTMDYISFGRGKDVMVILPGLGDGLTTVKGMAVSMAVIYRKFAKDFRVFVFSRKDHLTKGYSTREMAEDQAEAMRTLGIEKAIVLGVSQGGMIAQYLAIDHPELVEKLVLAVTTSKANERTRGVVDHWITLAKEKDHKGLMIDTAELSYSEKYLRKYRRLYPFLSVIGRPKSFERFLIQAASCMEHDAYEQIDKIGCLTLVIGGDKDRIVGVEASVELADRIKDSELYIYKGLGHALYEEAKDFNDRVLGFCQGIDQ